MLPLGLAFWETDFLITWGIGEATLELVALCDREARARERGIAKKVPGVEPQGKLQQGKSNY